MKSLASVTSMCLAAFLVCLAGCGTTPDPTPPATPELTAGEEYTDSLDPQATSTLKMNAKAKTFYAVWLSASGGYSVGVTISGDPLAAPVSASLGLLDSLSSEPRTTFYAESDGELQIVLTNHAAAPADNAGLINSILFGSGSPTTVTLRIDELGTDDHGETPAEATTIAPSGEPLTGTLLYGEVYDYFVLPVQLGNIFNVKIEATRDVTLATTNIDSFGQFNFNVPTAAGNQLSLTAKPGVPATDQFTIEATEPTGQVLLAVKAASGLLSGAPEYADYPISYIITVEAITTQQLQSGDNRSGHIEAGFTAQFFIDVPSVLSRLEATLSGPDGLALYVKKGEPASFEDFDRYLVLGGGAATDTLTIGPPQIKADRYYLTVSSIVAQPADYILAVEIK